MLFFSTNACMFCKPLRWLYLSWPRLRSPLFNHLLSGYCHVDVDATSTGWAAANPKKDHDFKFVSHIIYRKDMLIFSFHFDCFLFFRCFFLLDYVVKVSKQMWQIFSWIRKCHQKYGVLANAPFKTQHSHKRFQNAIYALFYAILSNLHYSAVSYRLVKCHLNNGLWTAEAKLQLSP